MKRLITVFIVLICFVLGGCGSVSTLIKKRDLDVQTKLSKTIWLDPSVSTEKTIFVQIRNTTPQRLNIETAIKNSLMNKGYKVVSNAKSADYWLQANVLKLSKYDARKGSAFESGILGAGVGAAIGAYNTDSVNTAIGLGLAGGLVATALDSLVEDINYIMVTDLLISEKIAENQVVTNQNVNLISQGTQGKVVSTSTIKTTRNKYQTRIVSVANKVNLKFEEAKPILENELITVISNIF